MSQNPYEEKLRQFCQDEVMFEAVRSVLLSRCDLNTAVVVEGDDAMLGQITRATITAREFIRLGFKDIEKYRHAPKVESTSPNPAV